MNEKLDALRGLLAKIEAGEPDLSFSLGKHIDAWPDDMWNGDTITLSTIGDAYQGSLDAAQSLHDAVLPKGQWPGDRWTLWQSGDSYGCSIVDGVDTHYAPTRARAWLAAILAALIAREATE